MRIFLFLVSLSYILETTKAIRCLTCTNARSNAQCKRLGKVVECQANEDACLNEIRRDDRSVLITKRCKQARACVNNFVQNQRDAWFPVQCNMARKNTVCRCCCYNDKCNLNTHKCPNDCAPPEPLTNGAITCSFAERENEISSQCFYKCNEGYQLTGDANTTCVRENYRSYFTNPAPRCVVPTCPPQTDIHNGHVSCTNGSQHGSICQFKCDYGFGLFGSQTTTCGTDNSWSHKRPYCVSIRCHPEAENIERGTFECTNHNLVGSVCTYTCEPGFIPDGKTTMTCNEGGVGDTLGVWSNDPPSCNPITCNDQGPLENGRYDCSEGNDVGSTCKFVCDEGYFLHPQHTTSNTCTEKFSVEEYGWNQPMPCCARGTPSMPGSYPPGAILDVVIALDTQPSVGVGNWTIQKRFEAILRRKLKEFSELTKIGDVSFKIRSESGPLLLNYPATPYFVLNEGFGKVNGPVYHVGIALQQIREISFTKENGDRPEAANVAVVVTAIDKVPDKREENWIVKNALQLIDDGVRVYAVGIGKGEKLRNILRLITGFEDSRTFQVDDYNELLTAVDRISQVMAPNLCTPRHPTH